MNLYIKLNNIPPFLSPPPPGKKKKKKKKNFHSGLDARL